MIDQVVASLNSSNLQGQSLPLNLLTGCRILLLLSINNAAVSQNEVPWLQGSKVSAASMYLLYLTLVSRESVVEVSEE